MKNAGKYENVLIESFNFSISLILLKISEKVILWNFPINQKVKNQK